MTKKRLSTKLALTASGTLPKADVLERWQQLPAGKQLNPTPIAYGAAGSSYGEDTLRITGSLAWVDSVLGNLRGLLRHENTKTVLDISFSEQTEKGSSKRVKGKYVVYIKLKEKARTTRARSTKPVPPAPTKPVPRKAVASTPGPNKTQEDALTGLVTLGLKRTDAERRLAAVVEKHGATLDAAQYITLALNVK